MNTAPQPSSAPQPPHLIDALADLNDVDQDPATVFEVPATVPQPDLYEPEAPARRQIGEVFAVDLEDGQQLEVRTTNRDLIAWEKTKARHREWPTNTEAPIFATTFVVWTAARRDGLTSLTFDQFVEACLDLIRVSEQPADPTR